MIEIKIRDKDIGDSTTNTSYLFTLVMCTDLEFSESLQIFKQEIIPHLTF